jgi:hypothetical protein
VTIPKTISDCNKAISVAISNSNPETISETNSDHSYRNTPLPRGRARQRLCQAVST